MMSLFSSFNPSSWFNLNLNWMTIMLVVLMMPNKLWQINPINNTATMVANKYLYKQFKTLMPKSMKMNLLLIMSIMTMIILVNTSSMYPYIYAPSSMPQLCIPMSMSMWMAINMKKMTKIMKMMSNLLPKNTPNMLIMPMILIETTSLLIQPVTLSIRLMANITAGHILVILVSSSYSMNKMILMLPMHMSLSLMEMCVAMIQAYVFSMLLVMFNK